MNTIPRAILGCLAAAAPACADAAAVSRAPFGMLPDGRAVEAITLTNANGASARLISYGAILQALSVPDRDGRSADIVLGYPGIDRYVSKPNYFGATVGRYANRIRAGRFAIDGQSYTLATNNGPNALHGGVVGFDKRLWTVLEAAGGTAAHVTFAYESPDGEEGYPGTLNVIATYSLNDRNELSVIYEAKTTKPTIVNITNHSFFNLGGEASGRDVLGQRLTVPADATTPVDAGLIPTGKLRPVAGTPFDFRKPAVIGDRIRDARDQQIVFGQGYDENFVVTTSVTPEPHLMARVEDAETGRVLEVLSNQPGVQVYTGNFLDGTAVGKSGRSYRQSDGLALEPQLFPDTPNQPAFGSARLDPGETYRNVIVYRFSTIAR